MSRDLTLQLTLGFSCFSLMTLLLVFYDASPAPLSHPHAQISHLDNLNGCVNCHAEGGLRQGCLGCHIEIQGQLDSRQGLHVEFEKESHSCIACHHEHLGEDFQLMGDRSWPQFDGKGESPSSVGRKGFQHDHVQFGLDGAHDPLDCEECHSQQYAGIFTLPQFPNFPRGQTFLGLQQTCRKCHDNIHEVAWSEECSDCHDQLVFRPAPRFDHDQYYVLGCAHDEVDCGECHVDGGDPPGLLFRVRSALDKECLDCHQSPHSTEFANDCWDCHAREDCTWEPASERMEIAQHQETSFPLNLAHQQLQCQECHTPGLSYAQRFPDPEGADARGVDECQVCHDDPHGGQFLPRYDRCVSCHTREKFLPGTFGMAKHHDVYPLQGEHAAVPCNDCHKPVGEHAAEELANLRVQPRRGEPTATENGATLSNNAHSTTPSTTLLPGGTLSSGALSIGETVLQPPLAEGIVRFVGIPRECQHCHRDPHVGQFTDLGANDCSRCHDKGGLWLAGAFDHDRDSRFPLDGDHENVPCEQCHPTVMLPSGNSHYVHYKPLRHECQDCHGTRDPNQGKTSKAKE